jgi:hypothetical protein
VVRVLFLGGLGRSGTTLLARLLGQLPGVCALGEVVHLWQRDLIEDDGCGCGDRFSECGFWQKVGVEAFGGWSEVDAQRVVRLEHAVARTRHLPRLAVGGRSRRVAEYAEYYRKLYQGAATVSGSEVVVDSSKHSPLAYCLRRADDIDLRVIHVVRDPRGVAHSWTQRVPRPEAERDEELPRYSPTRSAMLWNVHNGSFSVLRRRGVPVRRVRYEDLIDNPATTLRSLAEFAGLESPTVDLSFLTGTPDGYTADLGPEHTAAGNPVRFTIGSVPLRRDDAWRHALPAGKRRLVTALTAPLRSAYGYEARGAA